MSALLILASLTASPAGTLAARGYASMNAASQALSPEMQTGTLLLSKGDCLAVRVFTQSPYTHVAAVVVKDGRPFVYDATSGVGVRCQEMDKYLISQNPDQIHVFHPRRPFPKQRSLAFQQYLDSQLGKPYAIKHHLTGKRAHGIHCAEYVIDALHACNLMRAKQPSRVSPASLVVGITKSRFYAPGKTVQLKKPPELKEQGGNWCDQLWIDTKQCVSLCCFRMKRWILCR